MDWCKNAISELLIHWEYLSLVQDINFMHCAIFLTGHTAKEPSIPKAGNCLCRKSLFAGNNWCYSSTMKTPVARTHPWWWIHFKAIRKVNALCCSFSKHQFVTIYLTNKSRDKTLRLFPQTLSDPMLIILLVNLWILKSQWEKSNEQESYCVINQWSNWIQL